jgi:hypothetical protein
VATGGNEELLRLDGRIAWHFPETEQGSRGDLFAQGADGSVATPAWIEAGMTYEFSLYGGLEFSKRLARILVKGVPEPLSIKNAESTPQEPAREDGVVLTAIPNPVFAGEEPGVTNITWSTGDGSEGLAALRAELVGRRVLGGAPGADDAELCAALRTEGGGGRGILLASGTSHVATILPGPRGARIPPIGRVEAVGEPRAHRTRAPHRLARRLLPAVILLPQRGQRQGPVGSVQTDVLKSLHRLRHGTPLPRSRTDRLDDPHSPMEVATRLPSGESAEKTVEYRRLLRRDFTGDLEFGSAAEVNSLLSLGTEYSDWEGRSHEAT